ncbi:glycosyl transferase, group 1 [Magnetococcus marinus MC-1]|uniref:Glycosyl transferase, group 1 n=1 Tax=Magnetococcus marinus (strain ATCC BAA-1437 / JCM 17883 / MC-1) TaxID=156889 RepID=A0LCV7_MAGMM|nr:glycosyltransferase [Magnetococcus marinus]ABK45800.1 glycosyl transferase, group 1 [Magnetococcus marinus MC-1]
MLNRPPILALAPHSWHDRWLSRQQLMSRLGGRGWPVTYSYGPLNVWQRESPLWQQAGWLGGVEQVDHVQVDQPGRWFPAWQRYPWWDHVALRLHAQRMQALMGHAQADRQILFLFHPRFWPYVERLQPRYVVYHIYDVFSVMDNWSPQMDHYQQQLVERADLITTSSQGMLEQLPTPGPQKAKLLNNGADPRPFIEADGCPCPADLAMIPGPRIGYVGTVNAKLDLEMILYVASRHPHWHWVFIGPVMLEGEQAKQAKALWQQCCALDNVHLLGAKPRQAVPAYVQHMDVNTICYRIRPDDWVIHGYPVKLHEYLATGKPVVAAAQSAVKDQFSHVAAIAQHPQQWADALQAALTNGGVGTPQTRRQVALLNTWDQRTSTLENWLLEMLA